jgi:hypothetical protein
MRGERIEELFRLLNLHTRKRSGECREGRSDASWEMQRVPTISRHTI